MYIHVILFLLAKLGYVFLSAGGNKRREKQLHYIQLLAYHVHYIISDHVHFGTVCSCVTSLHMYVHCLLYLSLSLLKCVILNSLHSLIAFK